MSDVVGTLLRARAADHPERRFCSMGPHGFTYGSMDRRADEVAAGFAALGVERGDRVAILSPNRVEILELFFGLARLGAIQVPLNAYLKGAFLKYQLADSDAKVLVVDADGLAAVQPLLGDLPGLEHVVRLDDGLPSGTGPVDVAVAADDVMSILYTSGTTGLPKGCVLQHGYYCRAGQVNAEALDLGDDDAVFCALPLFHSGARLLVLMTALTAGIPVAFDEHFSARGFFPRAIETDTTVVIGMGPMAMALMALPEAEGEGERDHRIHTMMVAPLSPDAQARFADRFGIDPWVEVYGLTECVPVTCSPRKGVRDRASAGMPAADLEVTLLDDEGLPVPDGEPGEICVRPRGRFATFSGYWNNAEATVEAFRGLWFHTGDMGRRLESGALAFVDRKKDAMRRRGENVSSMELEAAIREFPPVQDVATHAVPSPLGEDDIKAVIVLHEGQTTDAEALFAFFRDNVPFYAMPRYVELAESLPKTAVGRVRKHELRERGVTPSDIDFEALGLTVARDERRKVS